MATHLENLITRKNAIGVELAAMDPTKAGGKPDAGKSQVNHVAYRLSLLDELAKLEGLINTAQANASIDSGEYFSLEIGTT